MSHLGLLIAFFLFSSPFRVAASANVGDDKRPNIILILSDDHSFPHAGCYGDVNILNNNITPNLDRFAKQGMTFNRAYTTAPQCAPSRTSMFTGQHPVGLGVSRFAEPARSDVLFFTDILRKSGYWVGLDGRHQHLNGRAKDTEHIEKEMLDEGMKDIAYRFDHFITRWSTRGENLKKVPARVDSILGTIPKEKPFFLYFGFNQPHRRFVGTHAGIDPQSLTLPGDWPDLPEVREDYARYLSDVRDMDTGFGSIMSVLERRGLTENTIVIFMGDNGEALLRGKGTLYSRGLHVPLIVRWPASVTPSGFSEALVSGEDLAPTILEATGMRVPYSMTGQSFYGALTANSEFKGRKYVFGERGWHWGPLTRADGFDLSRSITSKDYLFIYNALPKQPFAPVDMVEEDVWKAIVKKEEEKKLKPLYRQLYFSEKPVFELYDLRKDPYQLNNVYGDKDHLEIGSELSKEMDRWMIREHDFLPLPSDVLRNVKSSD